MVTIYRGTVLHLAWIEGNLLLMPPCHSPLSSSPLVVALSSSPLAVALRQSPRKDTLP